MIMKQYRLIAGLIALGPATAGEAVRLTIGASDEP
jgi:hypothetical protein